jgi:ribosome recycling factor
MTVKWPIMILKKVDISEDAMKIAEDNVQELTDTYIQKVDRILK